MQDSDAGGDLRDEGGRPKLAAILRAEPLPAIQVVLPGHGATIAVTTLLRRERRAAATIPKAPHCWAPNKVAVEFDGGATWPEFVIVRLLESAGWEARWVKNWTGGREFCANVDEPRPLSGAGYDAFETIHAHRPELKGAGTWDVLAWRDNGILFIESKQHRSSDRLRPGQIAFLETALELGFASTSFAVVEYEAIGDRFVAPAALSSTKREVTHAGPSQLLKRLIEEAAAASSTTRIDFRDPIAAHGHAAVTAMETWVAEGRSTGFAIRVIEAVSATGQPDAARALRRLRANFPDWAEFADAAIRRLGEKARPPAMPEGDARSAGPSHERRRTGILGPEYLDQSAKGRACDWMTRSHRPCQNPANYQVEGRYSCSRDHRL